MIKVGQYVKNYLKNKYVVTMSAVFSFFILVGGLMKKVAYGIDISVGYFALTIAYSMFMCIIMLFLIPKIESRCLSDEKPVGNKFVKIGIAFITILLLNLPLLVAFFPGTLNLDAYIELRYAALQQPWIAHYSVLVDQLLFKILTVGKQITGNDNVAFFIFTGTQFFLQTLIFSYTYYVITKINSRKFVKIFSLFFFALQPALGIWGYTLCKDTMYNVSMLLILALCIDMDSEEKGKWWQYLLLCMGILICTISRKNGVYVMSAFCLVGLIFNHKRLRFILVGLCIVAGCFINVGAERHYGAQKGYVREMLSVPIQQTARYIVYHGEELSQKELDAINSVFVVSVDEIAKLYEPELSDPVKFVFAERPTKEELRDYFGAWAGMFVQHPGTYVSAFLSDCFGYFDLTRQNFWGGINGVYTIGENYTWEGRIGFSFSHNPRFEKMRNIIETIQNKLAVLFPISVFCCCGLYTFVLLYSAGVFVRSRNYRNLHLLVPGLMTLAFCMISPVNAMIRYALPIFEMAPLLIAYNGRYIIAEK